MISKADITPEMRRCMVRTPALRVPKQRCLARTKAESDALAARAVVFTPKPTHDSTNASLTVFIPCHPPTTTAQQKGAFAAKGGGVRFFRKKKTKQAESLLSRVLAPYTPAHPCTGPLSLCVDFVFSWRKSEKKSRIAKFSRYPIPTRPDAENLFKLCGDVMTDLGFWHDDAQIAVLRVSKFWGDNPGIGLVLTAALAEDKSGNVVSA